MDNTKQLRQFFLMGFNDAFDTFDAPNPDLVKDEASRKAWQAGWDHWQKLVQTEQKRLENALVTGDDFPKW